MNLKKLNYKKYISNFVLNFVAITIIVCVIRKYMGGVDTPAGYVIRTIVATYLAISRPLLFTSEPYIKNE